MTRKNGIGSHQSATMKTDEWLTPPELLNELGNFDLDPCAPINRPWDMASKHFTTQNDGLSQEWHGRVWCNPPYSKETAKWLQKLCEHGNGIALIFARTETKMFFDFVWEKASAVKFIQGRLYFHRVDGSRATANAGAPSVLIAYGDENAEILKRCSIKGKFIQLETRNLKPETY